MRPIIKLALLCLLVSPTGWSSEPSGAPKAIDKLVIYTAKKIITMEPALPEATAVAVADGKIVAVGSLESLDSKKTDQ